MLHIKAPKRELRHLFKHKDNVGMKPVEKKIGYKEIKLGLRRSFVTLRALSVWNGLAGHTLEAVRVEHCTFMDGILEPHVDNWSVFDSQGLS